MGLKIKGLLCVLLSTGSTIVSAIGVYESERYLVPANRAVGRYLSWVSGDFEMHHYC